MNFDMDFLIDMIDNSDEFGLPSSTRAGAKSPGAKKKGEKGAKKNGKKGGKKDGEKRPEKEGDKGTKKEGKAPTEPLPKEGTKGDDTKDTKKGAKRRRLRIHQVV
jgi:hypothetical protein